MPSCSTCSAWWKRAELRNSGTPTDYVVEVVVVEEAVWKVSVNGA